MNMIVRTVVVCMTAIVSLSTARQIELAPEHLCQTAVNVHVQELVREQKKQNVLYWATVGAASAGAAWVAYCWHTSKSIALLHDDPNVIAHKAYGASVQTGHAYDQLLEALKEKYPDDQAIAAITVDALPHQETSWFGSIKALALNFATLSTCSYVFNKACSIMFDQRTILHYWKDKTGLNKTYQTFKAHKEAIDGLREQRHELTQLSSRHLFFDMIGLYNLALKDIERVVAYMQVYTPTIDEARVPKQTIISLVSFIKDSVQATSQKLDAHMITYRTAPLSEHAAVLIAVYDVIDQLFTRIVAQVNMYATHQERSA